jgi:hypothetical protein
MNNFAREGKTIAEASNASKSILPHDKKTSTGILLNKGLRNERSEV